MDEQSEMKPHEQKVHPLTGIDLADDYNREVRHADAIQQHKCVAGHAAPYVACCSRHRLNSDGVYVDCLLTSSPRLQGIAATRT